MKENRLVKQSRQCLNKPKEQKEEREKREKGKERSREQAACLTGLGE